MVGVTLCHLFKYTNYKLTGPLYVQYRLQQRSISLNDYDYWHFLSNGLALHYITFSTFIYAVDGYIYIYIYIYTFRNSTLRRLLMVKTSMSGRHFPNGDKFAVALSFVHS